MTTQFPNSCTFDGRKWEIEDWDGPTDCIPTNDQLGFQTVSTSTANWSGRIDHFLVHHGQLYLFKVEVNLAPENKGILPFGSRREIVLRYEQMEVHGDKGMRLVENEVRYECLIFDDLIIPFTGAVYLSYPFFDPWEIPWPIEREDEESSQKRVLIFKKGVLLDD